MHACCGLILCSTQKSREQSFCNCTMAQIHAMEESSSAGHTTGPTHGVSPCVCDNKTPQADWRMTESLLPSSVVILNWIKCCLFFCRSFSPCSLTLRIVSCIRTFIISISTPHLGSRLCAVPNYVSEPWNRPGLCQGTESDISSACAKNYLKFLLWKCHSDSPLLSKLWFYLLIRSP